VAGPHHQRLALHGWRHEVRRGRHPDQQAIVDIGKNVRDPRKHADAARAGLRQAADVLDEVRKAWL
jgi:hypothetical protein